jgi:hypothetical protein
MTMLDTRRPALVTTDFHARLAAELAPLGFIARRNALVRKRGKSTHRIEMSSSHHNAPGAVTSWIALVVTDTDVARVEAGWRAGGSLGGEAFHGDPPTNVADSTQANELAAHLLQRLAFFDFVDDAPAVLAATRRRYVPGMIEPRVIVPYLLVRLGEDAVESYARALLRGRPELWPAFVGASSAKVEARPKTIPDQGTELALSLAKHGLAFEAAPPRDTVVSSDLAAANLRCFFGRQLRAWGEAEAAGLLRRVPDARIRELRAAQENLPGPFVDEVRYATTVLHEVTGETRPPRRKEPTPRLFQYFVLHEPFGGGD